MNPLERVASWVSDNPQSLAMPSPQPLPSAQFDLEAFIQRHGLKTRRHGPWNGGEKWELESCPMKPAEHTGGCAVITRGSNGALGFKCQHNACAGIGWKELRARLEPNHRTAIGSAMGNPDPGHPEIEANPNGGPSSHFFTDIPSVRAVANSDISYVVAGLIPEGAVVLLSSESGAGKTTVALDIAGRVSKGSSFAGRATKARSVLILDRENPASAIRERLDRFHLTDGDTLRVWGRWLRDDSPGPEAAELCEWVRTTSPKPFLIFDSLVAFHDGDENSSSDTRAYMNQFRRLADLGATVLVLCHSGKAESAQEYRGSSDIKASVDVAYHLANTGDPAILEHVRLKAFKCRLPVESDLTLTFVDGAFVPDDRAADPKATKEALIGILREDPGIRTRDFEAAAGKQGIARKQARAFLDQQGSAGRIRTEKGLRNAKRHFWSDEPTLSEGNVRC